MIVYAVTVIDVIGDPVLGLRRTPAVYTSLEEAIRTVRDNEDDIADNNLYQYAVIEETLLNSVRPYIQDGERLWFRYNSVLQEFEPCAQTDVPRQLIKLYGFGIG